MKALPNDWLTTKWVDFEYKKYQLLAYLKSVNEHFDQKKLYPEINDLSKHHRSLIQLVENKNQLKEHFPERLTALDLKNRQLIYERLLQDPEIIQELDAIIHYALPRLEQTLETGNSIYQSIADQLNVEPVGLLPLYKNEGYLLLQPGKDNTIHVYRYQTHLYGVNESSILGVRTKFLYREVRSLSNSLRQIKLNLIQQFAQWPNPATYFFGTTTPLPIAETLLPVSKGFLRKNLLD